MVEIQWECTQIDGKQISNLSFNQEKNVCVNNWYGCFLASSFSIRMMNNTPKKTHSSAFSTAYENVDKICCFGSYVGFFRGFDLYRQCHLLKSTTTVSVIANFETNQTTCDKNVVNKKFWMYFFSFGFDSVSFFAFVIHSSFVSFVLNLSISRFTFREKDHIDFVCQDIQYWCSQYAIIMNKRHTHTHHKIQIFEYFRVKLWRWTKIPICTPDYSVKKWVYNVHMCKQTRANSSLNMGQNGGIDMNNNYCRNMKRQQRPRRRWQYKIKSSSTRTNEYIWIVAVWQMVQLCACPEERNWWCWACASTSADWIGGIRKCPKIKRARWSKRRKKTKSEIQCQINSDERWFYVGASWVRKHNKFKW